ncbi:MAG: 50S ribosomal protein L35 [Deltaproteobacteria bacterium]|nr:50S ribosomal protein L35 [Deltaproteobacteria bacterium]
MPKVKSHRGAAKRIRKTGKGLLLQGHANKRHILTKKTTARKRRLRGSSIVDHTSKRAMLKLLPY